MDRNNNAYWKSINRNDHVASYAIQIESSNRDANYIKKDKTNPGEHSSCQILFGSLFMCVVVFLICWLSIYLTTRDPYSDAKDPFIYKHRVKTQQYGIDFYVKSGFNKKHPVGSPARVQWENKIIKQYNDTKQSDCHYELWQKWLFADPYYSTPNCDDLKRKGIQY